MKIEAWNYGVFEDDTDYDTLNDLKASLCISEDIEKYFDIVIDEKVIGFDERQYALVSTAVIIRMVNKAQYKCDDENYFQWIETIKTTRKTGGLL